MESCAKPTEYWWYITLKAWQEDEDALMSLADISESIGTELLTGADRALRVRCYYRSSEDIGYWKSKLLAAMEIFPNVEIEDCGKIENRQWHVAVQDAFPPLPVGEHTVVLAPWHKGTEPCEAYKAEGRTPLYINPAAAFGTGYHESTQIVLELMEKYLKEGDITADIGTGSGILTIAALKMGAKYAYARDIDPAVIGEVRNNFALNDISDAQADLATGDLLKDFDRTADLLTANILISPLVSMVKDVPRVIGAGGHAIFSGMLEKEKPVFLKALDEAGMEAVEERVKGDWWGVAAAVKA